MNNQQRFISVLDYLNLYRDEEKYKVVCPFHEDQNASLLIDLTNSRFYCFGCGVSGSTYELINLAFPNENIFSALKKIDENKKVFIKRESNIAKPKRKKNISNARDYYYNLPKVSWYRVKDEEILLAKQYLKNRGYKMKLLTDIGAKFTYNNSYPIIFPIFDNNIFRGYVCRTTDKEVEKKRKYLYNEGFSRSTTLDGTYKDKTVVICEGHMDMLKAKQIGVENIVAILGWKISSGQIKKLKNAGIKKIICALDNDEAGEKGYKYMKTLNDFKVKRLKYPEGCKDFGDINNKNAELVLEQIKKYGGK